MQDFAPAPRRLEIFTAVVSQPEVQVFPGRGLPDYVGMTFELVADGGPDKIGAVRVEPFLNHQVDLTEIDKTKIDRDLFGIGRLRADLANVAGHWITIRIHI